MIETIDDLVNQIRRTLPQSGAIRDLKPDDAGHFVSFHWNGRGFVVKKDLEVFELKNNRLFVTGASMLMQAALSSKTRNQRILEACAEVLKQAEELLTTHRQEESGLKLISKVKATISKMSGRPAQAPKQDRPLIPVGNKANPNQVSALA